MEGGLAKSFRGSVANSVFGVVVIAVSADGPKTLDFALFRT